MRNLFERKLTSERVYDGDIFIVKRDTAELPEARTAMREVVVPNDGVVIAAEKDGKIIMVKQFRYPIQDILYELPAGKLDKPDENILDAAKRELEEETGYTAEKWEELGFIFTTPGFCTERLYLYKASGLTFAGQHLDEDELLDVVTIDLDKAFEMIQLGIINDAKSIAGIIRAYKS